VLAACNSGVSGRGYDEAFSIATALMLSGVPSVVSALWSVPDGATSAMMYMFHHYLRRHALPPRDALRAAQLWMLDPRRQAPPELPASLRDLLAHSDPADVVAWAGFFHQGR
jgi:CHAT domain-containing protein